MLFRNGLIMIALCSGVTAVHAWDAPASRLPLFASTDSAPELTSSFWLGARMISGPFAFSQTMLNMQGGSGNFAGYNHVFANKTFMSVTSGAGFTSSVNGHDFTSARVKFGYDMGRFRPYVTADALVTHPKPFAAQFGLPNEYYNGPLGPPGLNARNNSFVSAGAGFDYALTNKISIGVGVSVSNGNGVWAPLTSPALR